MLISLDGIDTAGKSTQAELLSKRLNKKGLKTKVIHFPNYESVTGKIIRDILDSDKINEIDSYAFQYLYIADQMNMSNTISKLLEEKYIVILDRYDLSTLVYSAAKVQPNFLNELLTKQLNVWDKIYNAQQFLIKPDVTFIFNLDCKTIFSRKKRLDNFEKDILLMDSVSAIYQDIGTYLKDGRIIKHIDASASIEVVNELIIRTLEDIDFKEYI